MTEWAPPYREEWDRYDYLGRLLVISTPDGFTSRWEDQEPPAVVRSEVAEFARRMSTEDFTNATPTGRRISPDEKFGRTVFLRLKVRSFTAEQVAARGRERAVDFEFGPMGAPSEYPRVSINDLFRYAAESI